MATITVTKLVDGPRNAVFHVAVAGDAMGDVDDEVLVDLATSFDPALPPVPSLTIERLMYDLTGFDARLEFDYLVGDTPVWTMSERQSTVVDFTAFGGLKDRSDVMDGTGKLMMTTNGLGVDDHGTVIIMLRKT